MLQAGVRSDLPVQVGGWFKPKGRADCTARPLLRTAGALGVGYPPLTANYPVVCTGRVAVRVTPCCFRLRLTTAAIPIH
jgi:hypothetical protein